MVDQEQGTIPPACQAPDPNPRKPHLGAPAGTCDTHFHVFGPLVHFPYQPDRSYTPPEASVETYRRLQATLGIDRCVIVQPSVYGTDNACTLTAMQRLGSACRGVAVIDETFETPQLDALHAAGIRGIRFNLLFRGGTGLDSLERLAKRIAPLHWHVQLLLDGRDLPAMADRLQALPVDIVVDHMGHAPAALGVEHPGNQALLALVRGGRCWVKLSGAYRISNLTVPYADVTPLAHALIAAGPERVVWGSDWPHPAIPCPMPNDGDLFDLVGQWTDDPVQQHKLLASNAAVLYGFPPV